jgi:hypothetical protein
MHHPLNPGGDNRLFGQIGTEKLDAGVGRSGIYGQVNGPAGMQANTTAADSPLKCLLMWFYLKCHCTSKQWRKFIAKKNNDLALLCNSQTTISADRVQCEKIKNF